MARESIRGEEMAGLALLLLGVTLVYTGVLTAARDVFVGLAIAVMGAGICIKPILDFFRRNAAPPRNSKVADCQKRPRRKKNRGLPPNTEKQPTIH